MLACFLLGLNLGITNAFAADLPIYIDSLAAGWVDWSWGSTRDFSNTSPVHSAPSSIAVTLTAGWAALYLHTDAPVALAPYDQIRFWVNGGPAGKQQLAVSAGNSANVYSFTAPANGWTLVSVPLSALGNPANLKDLYIQDQTGSAQPVFYVDDITLVQRPSAPQADQAIYTDALAAGWQDWSWGTTRNLTNTTPVHGGTNSASVTFTAGWAAFYLHTDSPIDAIGYGQLRFWIHGGSAGNQKIQVVANGGAGYAVTAQANAWTQVGVPLSALGNFGSINDLYFQDATGAAQPTFYLDDVVLATGSAQAPPVPQKGPDLSINVGSGRHAISADIYGMNIYGMSQSDAAALATELRLPVSRRGGNGTTRYNWQNDTLNTGADWYFENIREDNPNPATLPDGSAADRFVEQNRQTGTKTLMTVPVMGWVAKRRVENHPYDCGFKVSKYGAQQSTDQWDSDCGNGVATNGNKITGNDPTDTSLAVGPEFITSWINHLTGKYGFALSGGVAYYALDNEPMLWNSTHRDVHPQGTTYDELRDHGYQYGAAIKAADPSAKIFGPVEWGWCGYFYSAADGCGIGSDYQAHGNTPFVAWYLQQMRTYEQQHGVRILDYFDLHYYPSPNNVSLSPAGDAGTQALRLRSTRSLWDPGYIDESWISTMQPGGIAVQMIPRMKDWVAANYPGTKLAITEYNWGGLESINGALAQADVLGIFGREGLDLATMWGPPTSSQPGAYAFRMFRNYDGAGHGFGETSVQASSADQGNVTVFAAHRAADNALTIMVINKSGGDLTSAIALTGFNPLSPAAVYRYSSAAPAGIEKPAVQAVTASGFNATFPASSITLFVILPASTPASVPGAPTGVSATPGNGAAAISFIAPANDGGAPISRYTASCAAQGGSAVTAFAATSPITVAGLTNNTRYACAVTATNSAGTGPPSTTAYVTPANAVASPANYQGAWWAGQSENGWGLAFMQHGNTLVAGWYYYSSNGTATWTIMPGCVWNAALTSCTGSLYNSTGAWLGNYNAASFSQGSVGTVTLSFTDTNNGTMQYTVNGVSGTKVISRFSFGSGTAPSATNYSDVWGGGTGQNGWGVVLEQEQAVMAGSWYTYNKQGQAMWYLINGGSWTNATTFSAQLTSATGSPLIGATYNPGQFVPVTAGSIVFTFSDANNATMSYTVDGVTQTKNISRTQF